MSSNPWITGVETIKRQTRAARCLAGRLQVRVCGLSLQLSTARQLSVTYSAAAAAVAACGAISVIPFYL